MVMRASFRSCGDLRLRVLSAGPDQGASGLLCLHGFTGRAESFLDFGDHYSATYQLAAPDLRGHGWSDRADSYSIRDYVADQAALLAERSDPMIVYGHSLGGLIALALAATHPDLVSACIAEDPPLFHRHRSIADLPHLDRFAAQHAARRTAETPLDLLHGLQREFPDEESDWHVQMAERLWTCDPAIWGPVLDDQLYAGLDIDAQLRGIRCPVLLLQGDAREGAVLFDEDIASVRTVLTDCQVVSFPGHGHGLRDTAFADVTAAVDEFLAKLSPC